MFRRPLISWIRERFLSSSSLTLFLTLQTEDDDVFTTHVSASHTHTQTLHLCVWVAPVLPWQPAAVSLFVCPWSREQTHANAGAEIRTEGGRRTTSVRAFLFTSELTTPTALPPALTCQAANVGRSCWYVYREGREKHVSSVRVSVEVTSCIQL